MTITRDNLKIFKPEQLGSSNEAGGQRTRNAVQSGKLNELFKAISDIDHAQSSLDIVKFYPGIDTQDTSSLLDGHIFISEAPTDDLVSILLAESTALDDGDRMVEMKEILESSVTAGALIREGAPGFLPNQNSFSRDYLESFYTFNGRQYRKITTLRVGQIICITVEYEGSLNVKWPRIQHFAQVIDTNAPGTSTGNVVFSPPITVATPDSATFINSENNCTKLRLVNEASPLKFHGVTKLTGAANAKQLAVVSTKQNLIPVVISEKVNSGLKLSTGSDGNVVKRTITKTASSSQTYTFATDDVMPAVDNVTTNDLDISFTSGGKSYGAADAIAVKSTNEVSITFSRAPDLGTPITISYISSNQYNGYDNANAFPANSKVTRDTMFGTFNTVGQGVTRFIEKEGSLYRGYTDSKVGIVNYDTGVITYVDDTVYNDVKYVCLVETPESASSTQYLMPVDSPVLDTYYMQVVATSGVLLSASANSSGVITGTNVTGTIVDGFVKLTFATPVKISTLTYNITESVKTLPPADIYGLNPIRIPNGGLIDIFRVWGTISVQHTQYQAVSAPVDGKVMTIRTGARFVDITDSTGKSLWTDDNANYLVDSAAGTVTLKSTFSGFVAPFVLGDSIGELALVTAVTDTSLSLAKDLTREYPLGASVSSVQKLGDMQARVGKVRDMISWSGNWDVDGVAANSNLNTVDYPIEVTNDTAINEDWVLIMGSSTTYRCVGRLVGQIGTGDTSNDFAPINSITGTPFFTVRAAAFGGGWSAGEAIRFQTFAASNPSMAVRTVQAGHSQITTDKAVLSFRGNES